MISGEIVFAAVIKTILSKQSGNQKDTACIVTQEITQLFFFCAEENCIWQCYDCHINKKHGLRWSGKEQEC